MIHWLAVNWTEVLGFVTGAASVVLAVLRNAWNYPVGLANNVVFVVLFLSAGLYGDAGLQVVFAVLGLHGWYRWTHRDERESAYIARTPVRAVVPLIVAGIVLAVALYWLLASATDSTVPLADGSTTAVSLVAQYMLNRKWIENWWVWLGVDIGYVWLYVAKGLILPAILYFGFAALCVTGFLAWRAIQRRGGGPAVVPPAAGDRTVGEQVASEPAAGKWVAGA